VNITVATVDIETISRKAMLVIGTVPPRPWEPCNNLFRGILQKLVIYLTSVQHRVIANPLV